MFMSPGLGGLLATAGGRCGLEETGGGPLATLMLLDARGRDGSLRNDGKLYTLSWLLLSCRVWKECASME